MRFFHTTLALTAAAAVALMSVVSADPKQYTLDDCKWALNSLKEKPYSSSLPSMAASTGTFSFSFLSVCVYVWEEWWGRAGCVCGFVYVGVGVVPLAWVNFGLGKGSLS